MLGVPEGSPAARAERMTALHADHARAVLRLLLVLTRDQPQTAEDLLQETMLRAWRHLDSVPVEPDAARRWLKKVHKVRVTIRFRGREMDYPEIALEDLREIAESLSDLSVVEQAPMMEGRTMLVMLAPGKPSAKKKDKAGAETGTEAKPQAPAA